MKNRIVCTLCPNGCEIDAEYTSRGDVQMRGNRCEKGYDYAVQECFDPQRTFTGSVLIKGSYRKRMPVRSSGPIPKDKMMTCAASLKEVMLEAPVEAGHVVLENFLDTGADIITTMSLGKELHHD